MSKVADLFAQGKYDEVWQRCCGFLDLSISDFMDYCQKQDIRIQRTAFIGNTGMVGIFPNLLAQTGLFLISK